jgi:hypothetical protein
MYNTSMTKIATFTEMLNDAKKCADNLKSYFKERKPAAIDEHGKLDMNKCREHLEKLLRLSIAKYESISKYMENALIEKMQFDIEEGNHVIS